MHIDLIGVPMDFGAGRRGVDMGPSAIRYAGLNESIHALGHLIHESGNIAVPIPEMCKSDADPKLRNIDCIVPISCNLMARVSEIFEEGHFPIALGGDHSLSLGSIKGAAKHKKIGVLWIDAHTDFNTPDTTPSGNIHGMPLAALTGRGDPRLVGLGEEPRAAVNPARIAIIGARDIDPGERENLREAGVRVFSMHEVDSYGINTVMQQALDIVMRGTEGFYLSFDMDSIDPLYAPGVGTPVQGGLSYREAHLICEMVAESGKLVGMDFVEVNPILDDRNKTAELAVELILSALGKRVW
ncbi:MAG: arginase [Anaerolineales bacterium]|jgi:arginase|nr:arginase [Anaerolineales bacterium]